MPLIKTIDSIKIFIYHKDHNPPHFHAIYADREELITIHDLQTYKGSLPTNQRKKVIQWATEKQHYLIEKWNEFNPS